MADWKPTHFAISADQRIEAQAAEIKKLRGALGRIANSQPRPKRNGDYNQHDVSNLLRTARAALGETE